VDAPRFVTPEYASHIVSPEYAGVQVVSEVVILDTGLGLKPAGAGSHAPERRGGVTPADVHAHRRAPTHLFRGTADLPD